MKDRNDDFRKKMEEDYNERQKLNQPLKDLMHHMWVGQGARQNTLSLKYPQQAEYVNNRHNNGVAWERHNDDQIKSGLMEHKAALNLLSSIKKNENEENRMAYLVSKSSTKSDTGGDLYRVIVNLVKIVDKNIQKIDNKPSDP